MAASGAVEGNPIFSYLDAFDPDLQGLEDLKARYREGGVGDNLIKMRLLGILQDFLDPIRERRRLYSSDPAQVIRILKDGSDVATEVANQTLKKVKQAMRINYFAS